MLKITSKTIELEELAKLEHDQWMEWSKSVADEVSPERKNRWKKLWIPYDDLSEKMKEEDRIWARKVRQKVLEAIDG